MSKQTQNLLLNIEAAARDDSYLAEALEDMRSHVEALEAELRAAHQRIEALERYGMNKEANDNG